MSWAQPWAWLGIASLALPVLIHLLGRGHARVRPFPSLRFLERSKLLPTRRARLHDVPLLLVRLAILLAAVAALAGPVFRPGARSSATARSLVRAIVLDSNVAGDSARRVAEQLANEATVSVTLSTRDPLGTLTGASAWLDRQSGRRELVVITDSSAGGLTAADTAMIPADVGLQLIMLPSLATAHDNGVSSVVTDRGTEGEWRGGGAASRSPEGMALLASPSSRARLDAAVIAAGRVGGSASTVAQQGSAADRESAMPVAIVYSEYSQYDSLRRAAVPLSAPWMTRIATMLRRDSLLIDGARTTDGAIAVDSTELVIARGGSDRPLVTAAQATLDGKPTLTLFIDADPGSIASAALIAALDRARSPAPATTFPKVDDRTAAAWTRPSSGARRAAADLADASDGRWLWALVLVLLAVETWMRRATPEPAAQEATHERAA